MGDISVTLNNCIDSLPQLSSKGFLILVFQEVKLFLCHFSHVVCASLYQVNTLGQSISIKIILISVYVDPMLETLRNHIHILIRPILFHYFFSIVINSKHTILLTYISIIISIPLELSLLWKNYFICSYLLIYLELILTNWWICHIPHFGLHQITIRHFNSLFCCRISQNP